MLDYRATIHATEDAIHRRASLFRTHAIAIVAVVAVTVIYALAAGGWRALAALLFLIPLSGSFFLGDNRMVDRWRRGLLDGWTARDIDFEAFRAAMLAHPRLPRATLEGMLDTLPAAGDLSYEQTLQSSTRQAIAEACRARHRRDSDALMLKVLASALVAVAAVVAVWSGSGRPLAAAVVLLVVLIAIGAWLRRRRRATRDAKVDACRRLPGFDEDGYARGAVSFQ